MAKSVIQSESMNLADTFAFTGTVSGAGAASLVHLNTTTLTGDASEIIFNNSLINSTYDRYYISAHWHFDVDATQTFGRFLEADGTTEISGSSDYLMDNSTTYGVYRTGTYSSMMISQNIGSGNNHNESGCHAQIYVSTRIAGADAGNTGASMRPDLMANLTLANHNATMSSYNLGGRIRLINGNTPVVGTHAIGGLKFYTANSANFIGGSVFAIYGVL